PVHG
ncbi:hypothetical protein D037_4821B, partial [Vibrio parahaemolyticus IDH02640]